MMMIFVAKYKIFGGSYDEKIWIDEIVSRSNPQALNDG